MKTNEHKKTKSRLILNLAIITLIIVCIIMIALRWNVNQNYNIIEVKGNRLIPTEEIQNIVNAVINTTGKEKLKLEQINTEIQKHSYISKSIVTKENPQKIKIEIEEKQPIAIIVNDSSEFWFVDDKLNILPYQYIEKQVSLPLIRGIFNASVIDTLKLNEAIRIIEHLNKPTIRELAEEVSEIYLNREENNWYFIINDNDFQFILGKAENLEKKLKYAFYSYKFFSEKSSKQIRYIDLRWLNQIITKL